MSTYNNLEEAKQAEIDYIYKFKDVYNLTNCTKGGDHLGFASHSRETILKKSNTRGVDQYNILGELISSYEITEDAARFIGHNGSKITSCCKKQRQHAYGYI